MACCSFILCRWRCSSSATLCPLSAAASWVSLPRTSFGAEAAGARSTTSASFMAPASCACQHIPQLRDKPVVAAILDARMETT